MPREVGPTPFWPESRGRKNPFYFRSLPLADLDDDATARGEESDRFAGYFAVRIETIGAAI